MQTQVCAHKLKFEVLERPNARSLRQNFGYHSYLRAISHQNANEGKETIIREKG